jgi:hypothetical protein
MARKHPLDRKNGPRNPDHSTVTDADMSGEEYIVGPGCPPKGFQFQPGRSGNPKGAKRKTPSIAPDLKALLVQALGKKVKLRQGEKEKIVTKAAAGIEQLVNQFAKGDHRARRDLIALAQTLGVDLVPRKIIEEALASNHQAILDAFIARQNGLNPPSTSSPIIAPPGLLDDDSESTKPN